MITVTFFAGDGMSFTETEYPYTDAGVIMAHIDMINHIRAGGYCLAEYGNNAVMVSEVAQVEMTA